MKDYIAKFKDKDIDSISVVFYFKDGKADLLGKKLKEKNQTFLHDGKSWDIVISEYFQKNFPTIFEKMDTDPEPTMLTTYFELNKENEAVAKSFIEALEDIIEKELILDA
jgi:hypothetical protein